MILWMACRPLEPTATSTFASWSSVAGERVDLTLAGDPPQIVFDVWVDVDLDMLGSDLRVEVTAWSFAEGLVSLDLWQVLDDGESWLAGEENVTEPDRTVAGIVQLPPGSSTWRFRVESPLPGTVVVMPVVVSYHLPGEEDDASAAGVTPVDPLEEGP